ncbi:PadR family transcriptional regulator [Acidithiobacillus sp. AMEEHan]|uniref:PadR family transcriptional regulator n=1 Tax=Acidithiobacillus sp. AMEEHan TaxID=2994951 RepID=UPI0027E4D2D1|nr:PadR family transcriptional regulator [Acidithiobacillus sp. AMEEHan]
MLDQGMLRYVVLRRIAEQPRHGYDLIKLLEEQSGGTYSPSPGMMYPMLSMLEDQGILSVTLEGNKRLYHLTEQGQKFLAQNQALAAAIEERLSNLGKDAGEQTRVRLRALQDAVHERISLPGKSPEWMLQVQEILAKALEEIQALDR